MICASHYEVGQSIDGLLRVIPIMGGTFDGKIKGKIVPGGADWNTVKLNNIGHVFAKYLLETEAGEYIAIENEGVIDNSAMTEIITSPRFTAKQDGKYGWINSGIYVGSLKVGQKENTVEIQIYKML